MFLHRVHLNPRSKDARRDLADPYQMHATLCRVFCTPDTTCDPGALMWRSERETDKNGLPRVLIQSRLQPDWSRVASTGWFAYADPGVDIVSRLTLNLLNCGQLFRFRLRANPSKSMSGKRRALTHFDDQIEWLRRKGEQHGFCIQSAEHLDYYEHSNRSGMKRFDCIVSQEQWLHGRQHSGNVISIYSVCFEGRLSVVDPSLFRESIFHGVGHGKAMGLGLLSVAPAPL